MHKAFIAQGPFGDPAVTENGCHQYAGQQANELLYPGGYFLVDKVEGFVDIHYCKLVAAFSYCYSGSLRRCLTKGLFGQLKGIPLNKLL